MAKYEPIHSEYAGYQPEQLEDRGQSNTGVVRRWFPGWRITAVLGSLLTCLVLMTNISIAIYGTTRDLGPSGDRMIFNGDCTRSRDILTGWHVVINILSTLLLGACEFFYLLPIQNPYCVCRCQYSLRSGAQCTYARGGRQGTCSRKDAPHRSVRSCKSFLYTKKTMDCNCIADTVVYAPASDGALWI